CAFGWLLDWIWILTRFPHGSRSTSSSSSGLKGDEDFIVSLGKPSAGTQGMKNAEQHTDGTSKESITRHSCVPPANSAEDERRASGNNAVSGDQYALTTTCLEVTDNKPDTAGEIVVVGTTDCELMSSESGAGEMPDYMLAKITVEHGSVELYGYIAARDRLEPLLNYIVNFSRDDPIIVEQGSLINMAGPKRGIELVDSTLIEYDMKIKTGKHEDEDLQLIDGVSFIDDMETFDRHMYTCCLCGDGGVVNLAVSRLKDAVQATVEVAISQVRGKFIMQLGCFTGEIDEEIRIFDGAVVRSHGLRSSAVAVALDDHLDLRFKVAAEPCVPPAEHCCTFKASKHEHATEEIETDFALIAVKVTWSTLDRAAVDKAV
ncbi:hypothetical protein U9M48_025836, partial [Paspalum notatum var. saurae]